MTIVTIPLSKAKVKSSIDVELDDIHAEVYKEALILGLKVLLTRGTSKLADVSDEAERKAELDKIAAENVEKCKEGKIRFTSGSAKGTKVPGAVMTEARRLAKNIVKDEIKRSGGKISHYAASDITAAANELIAASPELIEQAQANLAEREKTPVKINVSSIPINPELVKKAEAKKAKAKSGDGTISAKQASMPAKRKAQPSQTAH